MACGGAAVGWDVEECHGLLYPDPNAESVREGRPPRAWRPTAGVVRSVEEPVAVGNSLSGHTVVVGTAGGDDRGNKQVTSTVRDARG